MRFADVRPTLIKKTPSAEGFSESLATPRYLSPFVDKLQDRLREGTQYADLLNPTYNRALRRRGGQTHPRKRLRDNAVKAHWLPVLKAQRLMERNLEAAQNG